MKNMYTPWGLSDSVYVLCPEKSVIRVVTPSHGGIGVPVSVKMPDHLTQVAITPNEWRWFEEDLDWCCVALAFPQLFQPEELVKAEGIMLNWLPEVYEAQFKRKPTIDESFKMREIHFKNKLKSNFVPSSGFGDWAWDVPKGQVFVLGRRACDGAEAGFLVPKDEYKNYSELVLDAYPSFEPDRTLPYCKPVGAQSVSA